MVMMFLLLLLLQLHVVVAVTVKNSCYDNDVMLVIVSHRCSMFLLLLCWKPPSTDLAKWVNIPQECKIYSCSPPSTVPDWVWSVICNILYREDNHLNSVFIFSWSFFARKPIHFRKLHCTSSHFNFIFFYSISFCSVHCFRCLVLLKKKMVVWGTSKELARQFHRKHH